MYTFQLMPGNEERRKKRKIKEARKGKKKKDEQKQNFLAWFSRLCQKVSGTFRVHLVLKQQKGCCL